MEKRKTTTLIRYWMKNKMNFSVKYYHQYWSKKQSWDYNINTNKNVLVLINLITSQLKSNLIGSAKSIDVNLINLTASQFLILNNTIMFVKFIISTF